MKNLQTGFTDKEIPPWVGIALLRQMLHRTDIHKVLSGTPLPEQVSNRGYIPEQLILNFWVGIWYRANCYEHLEITRQDTVIQKIFDWGGKPWPRAFQRYFSKFSHATDQRMFRHAILGTRVQNFMNLLRYMVFAVGSYMIKNGSARILKPSLALKNENGFPDF